MSGSMKEIARSSCDFCCFAAISAIDPKAHNFKVLVRHCIGRVMDSIPRSLMDRELGIATGSSSKLKDQPAAAQDPDKAQHAQQDEQPSTAKHSTDLNDSKQQGGTDNAESDVEAMQTEQQAHHAQQSGEIDSAEPGAEPIQTDPEAQHAQQAVENESANPSVESLQTVQEAQHAQQAGEAVEARSDGDAMQAQQAQHAKQAGLDGDYEAEEEGRVRLPLFTHKVMVMVQDLLQYKVTLTRQI